MRDVFSRDAGIFKSFKRRFRARVGAVFVVRQHVRALIPVLLTIHSSLVSTSDIKSTFVIRLVGTYVPKP